MANLESVRKFHCFFEQSGTFKKEFKRLGIDAIDYDILNDYGETDKVIDLFAEIENAYEGGDSIFDSVKDGEAIIAFFPCVRFSKLFVWHLTGQAKQYLGYNQEQKLEKFIELQNELNRFALLITKLCLVCIRKEIPLIIENPYDSMSYLNRYWPMTPAIVDTDRQEMGDWYKKPTQYFFINCDPLNNLIMDEAIAKYPKRWILEQTHTDKSMISPEYARRFIRTYLKKYDANDADLR